MSKISKEIQILLKTVVDNFDSEDRDVRDMQLRKCRRMKLYWNNFSQIYWSEAARDYRIYNANDLANSSNDQAYYDKPINILRALLETVIAALSIQVPSVNCAPDDVDNPADLSTAKAGDKIAELLYKHNDVMFLWLYALYVYYTEGLVACYNYTKEDKEYGTYSERKYKDEEVESYVCPHCGDQLEEDLFNNTPGGIQQQQEQPNYNLSDEISNEFGPDNDSVKVHDELNEFGPLCLSCLLQLDPGLKKSKIIIPRFVGTTDKAKSRICFDIKGMLYIKIPNYAKTQKECLYLIDSYETHYANALYMYPDLRDNLPQGGWANANADSLYGATARLNPQYRNAFPVDQVTVKNCWLRPAAFEILEEDDARELQKLFPDGVKVILINDIFAQAENESLDDCWTIARDPMHDYLNHDAPGELITNIQDITNDLISLTLQTIEHGIVQTWADPAVVNFDGQQQIEATPGYITPVKLQGGVKNISDAFFSTKSATLSPEVFQFYQIINQLGQFVSAAMPSIFGGSQTSGSSRTASEYAMSRTASLQRLQTQWRMMTIWWKNIFGKAIPQYMKLIKDDERYVVKDNSGNYVNVIIRRAELDGKIGSIELEGSENLPVSDDQKADIIMRLFELNNAEVMSTLTSPENLPFIRTVVKIPEFRLPGEDDRNKQYEEIQLLLQNEPITMPPSPEQIMLAQQTGQQPQPIELPNPEDLVDPLVDNHAIEADICRGWAVSEAGRLAKKENLVGYKNVLLHMKQHLDILAQQDMQNEQDMFAKNMQQPAQKENTTPENPEIKDVNDVRTPIK